MAFIHLIRPAQWIKNGFVLIPFIFSGTLLDGPRVLAGLLAFVCFCAAASTVYVLNDLADLAADRLHPTKRHRPLAAGRISPGLARNFLVGLFLVTLLLVAVQPHVVQAWVASYFLLNLAYSRGLKKIVVVDVFCVAIGFLIRVLCGTWLTGVRPSPWLLLMTFFVALLLGFGKRRGELLTLHDPEQRPVLAAYDAAALDQMLAALVSMIVVTFSMYTVSDWVQQRFHTDALVYTVPLVVFGTFRYLTIIRRLNADPTSLLLTDRPLLACVAAWLAACIGIVYAP